MSEDLIWDLLDNQFCSFKAKFEKLKLCKNEYNLTGVCNKQYCPLANGRYATIKEEAGVLYLNIKTIERAHTPAELWEKIALPDDLPAALAIINDKLAYWPKRFVNRVKERLVRLHQYIIRYRKYYYAAKPRIVTVHKKFERREQRREVKALVAAKLDTQIKQELLERLKQGTYEFININNKEYMEILREEKRKDFLARKYKANRTGERIEPNEFDVSEQQDIRKAKALERAKAKAEKEGGEVTSSSTGSVPLPFVADLEDDDDVGDIEDFEIEEEQELEADDLDLGEDLVEDDDDDDLEEDADKDDDDDDLENNGVHAIRGDLRKHFPKLFRKEEGDDEEMQMLKESYNNSRKRKLLQKHKAELKRAKDAQKKKKAYGAHVELEYEPSTSTATTTTTSNTTSTSSSHW